MIGKTVLSGNFEATLRYVYGKEGASTIDATIAAALVQPDPVAIAQEMNADVKDRSSKPCYHIALSPAEGDQLSRQQWKQLSRDFLSELGAEKHHSVVVLHTDATYPNGEERPHLHLVISRYESSTSNALCLHFPKIEGVIRKLERDYELESIPCSWEVDRRADASEQYHRADREQVPSIRRQLQTSIDQAIAKSTSVESFLSEIQSEGITPQPTDRGISFEKDGFHFAGYQLGKAYTLPQLEKNFTMNSALPPYVSEEDFDLVPDIQNAPPETPKAVSMADVMRQASEVEDIPFSDEPVPSEPEAESSQSASQSQPRSIAEKKPSNLLAQTGHTLEDMGRQIGGGSSEIDGMMMAGSAAQLSGAFVQLGDAILKRIEAERAEAQRERAEALMERLEKIGDRTERLERETESGKEEVTAPSADRSGTVIELGAQPEQSSHSEAAADPFAQSFNTAAQRLDRLEQSQGLSREEYPPIEFDHSLPIEAQLNQMEAAIVQFEQRLERIESAMLKQESTISAPPAQEVADHLANYVQARAQYFSLDPTEPIETRTLGTIEFFNSNGDEMVAIVEPQYGAKFEAVKLGEAWEIRSNDLTPQEAQAIVKLPQTVEAYEAVAQGRELVQHLQKHAPDEFGVEGGKISWREPEFGYQFDIATQSDGSQTVIGVDQRTDQPVFKAQVSGDGSIAIEQADIPKAHTHSLLHQPNPIVSKERTSFASESEAIDEPGDAPATPPTPESSRDRPRPPAKQRQRTKQSELSL